MRPSVDGRPPNHINCMTAAKWLKAQMGVWRFHYEGRDVRDKKQHPATFPISLAAQVIALFTHEGELVVDPFVGSGTTLVAARDLHRNAVGFDINRDYIDLCHLRLAQLPLELPSLPTTQQIAIQDDARNIADCLEPETVKLLFTSPPYANLLFTSPPYANLLNRRRKNKSRRGEERFSEQYGAIEQYSQDPRDLGTLGLEDYQQAIAGIYADLLPLLKPLGHCVINVVGGTPPDIWWEDERITLHIAVVEALRSIGYELRNTIIWDKTNLINRAGIFGWPANYGRTLSAGRALRTLSPWASPSSTFCTSGDPHDGDWTMEIGEWRPVLSLAEGWRMDIFFHVPLSIFPFPRSTFHFPTSIFHPPYPRRLAPEGGSRMRSPTLIMLLLIPIFIIAAAPATDDTFPPTQYTFQSQTEYRIDSVNRETGSSTRLGCGYDGVCPVQDGPSTTLSEACPGPRQIRNPKSEIRNPPCNRPATDMPPAPDGCPDWTPIAPPPAPIPPPCLTIWVSRSYWDVGTAVTLHIDIDHPELHPELSRRVSTTASTYTKLSKLVRPGESWELVDADWEVSCGKDEAPLGRFSRY